MNSTEFERKLQLLNPRLYLQSRVIEGFNSELLSTGIYLKSTRWGEPIKETGLGAETQKAVERMNEVDEYVGYCTIKHIPEGNWYDVKGTPLAIGWREILLGLHKKGLIALDKARKVFGCPSLGLSTYDSLTSEEKKQDYIKKPKKCPLQLSVGLA